MKPLQNSVDLLSRADKLREKLISQNLDAILISSQPNRYYLTGWQGDIESGYLLITPKSSFVITDSRYTEEASAIENWELREYGTEEKFWEKLFAEINLKRVGFEEKTLSVFALKNFRRQTKGVRFVATQNLVEELRSQKDEVEIALIKKSIRIADKAFEYVLRNIKIGQSEKEIAWRIEQFMRENGSAKNAWDPLIVASGPNSSKVHYAAGERKIKKGDQVLLDWGCVYQGYSCDISRVIFLGTPTSKQIEVYNLVLAAQEKGIEQVKVGNSTKKADLSARNFLKNKTKFLFGHGVGHGVGIEVHELPRINYKAKEKFAVGNIVTVEPGIYQPLWGGVRIEDMVLVTEKGPQILTKATKELKKVIIEL